MICPAIKSDGRTFSHYLDLRSSRQLQRCIGRTLVSSEASSKLSNSKEREKAGRVAHVMPIFYLESD